MKRIFQFISALLFRFLLFLSRIAPNFTAIVIRTMSIFLFRIIGYRKAIIQRNLKNSFPEWDNANISETIKKFHQVFSRYIIETLAVYSNNKQDIIHKSTCLNVDYWRQYIDKQKSIILMGAHYGNWETNIVLLPEILKCQVVGFYKPISNPFLESLVLNKRSRFGLKLIPIDQTIRYMSQHKNEKIVYVFISDQGPLNMNGVYWNIFLNQNTPWYMGAEKLAKKFEYPVLYLSQKPLLGSVWYELSLRIIFDDFKNVSDGWITGKYSNLLEKQIKSEPSFWLWSHKRWKRAHLS